MNVEELYYRLRFSVSRRTAEAYGIFGFVGPNLDRSTDRDEFWQYHMGDPCAYTQAWNICISGLAAIGL